MRLIFIRHGDPDYSIDSLTEKGWREAELLADRVVKWDVTDFYCSPLGRAKDTASCTLKRLNRKAQEFQWLREFKGRVLNPVNGNASICWDFMPAHWTELEQLYDKDNWAKSDLMMTSEDDIHAEWMSVCDGIDSIIAGYGYKRCGRYYSYDEHSDATIVIFCHLGVTMAMMAHLLGISAPALWHGFYLAPTSVTVLDTEERVSGEAYFRCQVMGDTMHLAKGGEDISASGYFADTIKEKW